MASFDLRSEQFWSAKENTLLLNPRLNQAETEIYQKLAAAVPPSLHSHVFIASSGSSGKQKLILLSKAALLSAASSVNSFFAFTEHDRWLLALPTFHVGGLSVFARAYLAGSKVVEMKTPWDAADFHKLCTQNACTLSSLVPTQIHDLVAGQLQAPATLKELFVGGASLSADLYQRARALGWPIRRCYGMSETAAFFAVSTDESGHYTPLPHASIKISAEQEILIQSPALLSGVVEWHDSQPHYYDPKDEQAYLNSGDLGELGENGSFKLWGRNKDFLKVLGERVSLDKLKNRLQQALSAHSLALEFELFSLPHERLGQEIRLCIEASGPHSESPQLRDFLNFFNQSVAPYERIRVLHLLPQIPRSALGKALLNEVPKLSTKTLTL